MTNILNEKDILNIIESLIDISNQYKNDHLQKLITLIQKEGIKPILEYINILFTRLQTLINDENIHISITASQLLLEIVNSSPKDIESEFGIVAGQLIINLGDSRPVVKKMALNNLSTFIKLTGNSDIILNALLKYGLENQNANLKQNVLSCLPNLVNIQSSIILNSMYFKEIIERILDMLAVEDEKFNSVVYQIIHQIKTNHSSNFATFSKNLTLLHEHKIKQILENPLSNSTRPIQSPSKELGNAYDANIGTSSMNLNNSNYKLDNPYDNNNALSSSFQNQTIKLQKLKSPEVLEYGIFPADIIASANNDYNWQIRATATENIYMIIKELKTLDPIAHYIDQIISLIIKLVNDVNFKICLTAMKILGALINLMKEKDIHKFKGNIIQTLLEKLGENKIVIRELSMNLLSFFINKIPATEFIDYILPFLSNSNWHTREESLQLIQLIIKQSGRPIDYNDSLRILNKVLTLAQDTKPKVKGSALETLCLVVKTSKKYQDILLKEISKNTDESIYNTILSRLTGDSNNPNENYNDGGDKSIHTIERPDSTKGLHLPEYNTINNTQTKSTMNSHHSKQKKKSELNDSAQKNPMIRNRFQSCNNNTLSLEYNKGGSSDYENYNNHTPNKIPYTSNSPSNDSANRFIRSGSRNQPNESSKMMFYSPNNLSNDAYINDSGKLTLSYGNNMDNTIKDNNEPNKFRLSTHNKLTPKSTSLKSYGINEMSTASSTRSIISRNANLGYSLESPLSSSSNTNLKYIRQPHLPNMSIDQSRIQSAQFYNINFLQSPIKQSDAEKRTYSANEIFLNSGSNSLQNKLINKAQQKEYYLDYSTSKNPDDFGPNPFDKTASHLINEGNEYYEIRKTQNTDEDQYYGVSPNVSQQNLVTENSKKMQNPYKTEKIQIASQLKHLKEIHEGDKESETDPIKNSSKIKKSSPNIDHNQEIFDDQASNSFKESTKKKINSHLKSVSSAYNTLGQEEIAEKDELNYDENELDDKSKINKHNEGGGTKSTTKITKRKIIKAPANNIKADNSYEIEYKKQGYLTKEELTPIQGNPEAILKTILADLKSDDWARQFEAMNNLRRLTCFHSQFLNSSHNFPIHHIIQEILSLIDSLRSSLSKNAMITLTEMIPVLKKQIDPELESIMIRLIKKGMDTNCFIIDEVKKGLISICQNCTENRILQILFSMLNHKSIPAKISICLCFHAIIERNESRMTQLKDFERMLNSLASYMLDGSQEVRNASKKAFSLILKFALNRSEIDRLLQKNFNEVDFSKIIQIIDKEFSHNSDYSFVIMNSKGARPSSNFKSITPTTSGKDFNDPTQEKSKISRYASQKNLSDEHSQENHQFTNQKQLTKTLEVSNDEKGNTTSKLKSSRLVFQKEGPEFEALPDLFIKADNSDWKARYDTITALKSFGVRNYDGLARSKLLTKYLDYMCKLLTDSNNKVSMFAILSFNEIIQQLKPCIETYTNNVMNTIFAILGSMNSGIKSAAENMFNNLLKTIDYSYSVPCLCNGLLFANPKAKTIILISLIEHAAFLNEKKSSLISKNIIPTLAKMLDENKPELKLLIQKCIQCYHNIIGKSILDNIPLNKIKQIHEILSSS